MAVNGIHGLSGGFTGKAHYGIQGPPGPQGEPFTYEDFTPEQLENLRGPVGPQGPIGNPGPQGEAGEDGGHYIPAVTQPDDNTLEFSFTPSKSDMPAVEPVRVELPAGQDSGGNAVQYVEQELTPEQQAQVRENIGIEELLTITTETVTGINLNDGVYEHGRFAVSGAEYDAEGDYGVRSVNYLPVEGGRSLVAYYDRADWNGNTINMGIDFVEYDSDLNQIRNSVRGVIVNYAAYPTTHPTLDANTAYIRIAYNSNGAAHIDVNEPKIAVYYLEDAVREFVEYSEETVSVINVRKDKVAGLNPLMGKKIVYDGDSICAGSASNAGGGYAKIISDLTGSTFINLAQGGGHLRSGVSDRHCVADNLPNLPTDGDIYCFQGGINDYWGNAVLGTYTPGDYTGAVDATTVCGALETIFRYALTNFPGKRVCFVITHKIQNTAYQTNSAGTTFKDYRDAMAGICRKYSIPFYDAFSESGLNGWNDAQNNQYLTGNADGTPDGCHPNEEGYRLFYVNQLIDLFENGRSSGSAEKGEPGKDGAPGADGDDYVLTNADKEEIAGIAAELVEVPEGSGGIAVTGATVGQTVKIAEVDENGVPTAWEPVDFPSVGSCSGGKNYKTTRITTTEEVSRIFIPIEHISNCELFFFNQTGEEVALNIYIVLPKKNNSANRKMNCCTISGAWQGFHYGRIFESENTVLEYERFVFWREGTINKLYNGVGGWIGDEYENGLYIEAKNAGEVIPVGAQYSLTEVY